VVRQVSSPNFENQEMTYCEDLDWSTLILMLMMKKETVSQFVTIQWLSNFVTSNKIMSELNK